MEATDLESLAVHIAKRLGVHSCFQGRSLYLFQVRHVYHHGN
jgi:hypothetical protein